MLSTSELHAGLAAGIGDAGPPDAGTIERTKTIGPAGSISFPRAPKFFLFTIAAGSLVGIAFALWLRTVPAGNADPRLAFNVFYALFARHEPAALAIVAAFNIGALVFILRPHQWAGQEAEFTLSKLAIGAIAFAVFAITATGVHLVFQNYLLTADENVVDFQACIFMRGKLQAQVPRQLWDAVRVIKPTFVDYFPATHSWNGTYLPVYAAMRAVFQLIGFQTLLNPLLAAVTLLTLFAIARKLWPNQSFYPVTAVLLMATSSQFLLMSMTAYAMPAHLALNTVWLWLYLQPDRRLFYLAPFVGVLAIGLHQPFPHALFVAPFLLRMLREHRWRTASIFAAVYALGCVGWLAWRQHFQAPLASGAQSVFRLWNWRMGVVQPMNLLLIISWSSLATPLLTAAGFLRFRKLPSFLQDCALSCVFTFAFYYFFYLDQAHGWGYRYFHGTLSCFVLIAVAGTHLLGEKVGRARVKQFVIGGALASLVIVLPLRCFQAAAFVAPYARTAAVLHAVPTQVVAVDARDGWYSADLIRNDPFLENRPIMVSIYGLNPAAVASLQQLGSVRFIDRDVLARLGMFTQRRNDYKNDPFTLGRGK
jgi:hypothetical protein